MRRQGYVPLLLLLLLLLLAVTSRVEAAGEFSGFAAVDLRGFIHPPIFPEPPGHPILASVLVQPEYRYTWNEDRDRLTAILFARYEYEDSRRRHVDVRELHWLHAGSTWDLLFGVNKVFWGVAESQHLVDIINQTDTVEDTDGEDKLGQPMVQFSLLQDWGTLTFFALPRFRERTFPGRRGRLRSPLPVDTSQPVFESSLDVWHPDFAVRWVHALGVWDVGFAHFSGTSREPRLRPGLDDDGRAVLVPHYDLIHQTSLELQATIGGLLGKLEVISRDGHGRRFAALVAGFEYTFFGVGETPMDLGVLAEYLYDGRHDDAPGTPFENDLFVGTRLALNDTQDTSVLAGVIVDLDTRATFVNVEASRRLGDRWVLELEVRAFVNVPASDVIFSLRRDDYVQLRIAWYF